MTPEEAAIPPGLRAGETRTPVPDHVARLAREYGVDPTQIPSALMEPTMEAGQPGRFEFAPTVRDPAIEAVRRMAGFPAVTTPHMPSGKAMLVSPSSEPGESPSIGILDFGEESEHRCTFKLTGASVHPREWKTAILYRCSDCSAAYSDILDGEWTMNDFPDPVTTDPDIPSPQDIDFIGLGAEWVRNGSRVRFEGRDGFVGQAVGIELHPTDAGKSPITIMPEDRDEPTEQMLLAHKLTALIELPLEDILRFI